MHASDKLRYLQNFPNMVPNWARDHQRGARFDVLSISGGCDRSKGNNNANQQ
jgi:hypothetical protein